MQRQTLPENDASRENKETNIQKAKSLGLTVGFLIWTIALTVFVGWVLTHAFNIRWGNIGARWDVCDSFVGSWVSTHNNRRHYVFYEDGTGRRGDEPFNWVVRSTDSALRIYRYPENVGRYQVRRETWDIRFENPHQFSMSITHSEPGFTRHGNNRNLQQRRAAWRSLNVDRDLHKFGTAYPALVGFWERDDIPGFQMNFDLRGHGVQGFEGRFYYFYWGIIDGKILRLSHGRTIVENVPNTWYINVTEESLILKSGDMEDVVLSLTRRREGEVRDRVLYPALMYTWRRACVPDCDCEWLLILDNTGLGRQTRYRKGNHVQVRWEVRDGNILRLVNYWHTHIYVDLAFDLTDDSLYLRSLEQEYGLYYIRQ